MGPLRFQTHPDHYKHWQLAVNGDRATLTMNVDADAALDGTSELKLNSYDLGVDIELADAVERLRFEHPEVRVVCIDSGHDRVFCAGANIPTLAGSPHGFKVNFCKFTNETRLAIEEASEHSGQRYLAALTGATAGGGYELALACDRILLVDDGSTSVSLPEVPLLGVLPGTGGLTRLVDKRKVRRDLADVLCTTSEGIRGQRALDWDLVDALATKSQFDEVREKELANLAQAARDDGFGGQGPGVALPEITWEQDGDTRRYRHLAVKVDAASRLAEFTLQGPPEGEPQTPEAMLEAGADQWALRAFRELDDAMLHLRLNAVDVGVWVFRTEGNAQRVLQNDAALWEHRQHWFAREMRLLRARVLRRLDLSARSVFTLVEQGSCFAGSLLELVLAADRVYMLDDEDGQVSVQSGPMNEGALPMSHGLSRAVARFCGDADRAQQMLKAASAGAGASEAEKLGLCTYALDDIDWEDDVRVAIEERASMSPDALSAMESNLRFVGPETCASKIFGRLSAWQNWVFIRPNATGERGALTTYGKPETAAFDFERC